MAETKTTKQTKPKTTTKPKASAAKKTDKPKEPKLEAVKKAVPKIDARIFAVKERKEWVETNQKALGIDDDHIIWDEKHEGATATARKAWGLKTESPYIMVLNDDVELCDDFMKYCEVMVDTHPDSIISLFPFQFRKRKMVRNRARRSPYITTKNAIGMGIIMKKEYVEPCLASWKSDLSDDVNITNWAHDESITILTTLPSTIQHIGDDSVIDSDRKVGRTDFFKKNLSDIAWDNDFINSWSNVVSH